MILLGAHLGLEWERVRSLLIFPKRSGGASYAQIQVFFVPNSKILVDTFLATFICSVAWVLLAYDRWRQEINMKKGGVIAIPINIF
jgi:hypothetical protein